MSVSPARSRSRSSRRSTSSASSTSSRRQAVSPVTQGPCPTCQTAAAHDCPFRVNDDLLDQTLPEPATVLTPPKNREQSNLILNTLPLVERLKLCMLQGWCVPGLYPLCFFSSIRMGRSGIPDIFSSYSALGHSQATQVLRDFLRVESRIILPKNIILLDEDRQIRLYLGPTILRPNPGIFTVTENDSSFTVTLSQNTPSSSPGVHSHGQSGQGDRDGDGGGDSGGDDDRPPLLDESDDEGDGDRDDDQGRSNDRPGGDGGGNGGGDGGGGGDDDGPPSLDGSDDEDEDNDDDDDGNSPRVPNSPSPNPTNHSHPAVQLIPNFSPGSDGLGAVGTRFKRMNFFRKPWEFDNQDIMDFINMTKVQFFNLVWKQAGCHTRQTHSELNIFSEVFLWLLKMTKDASNDLLRAMFCLNNEEHARQVFNRHMLFYYRQNVNIPNIISPDGSVNNAERRKLYQQCRDGMSPLYRRLADSIRDPDGRNRICVIINIDGSYIDVQGSGDIELKKFLWYPPRSGYVVKFLNFTTMDGKVIGLIPISTSQSPSSGDGFIFQRYVGLEDDGPSENYLRTLLGGDEEFFVCAVSDAGFVVRLRNGPTQVRDMPNMSQLCDQPDVKAFFIHTSKNQDAYLLKKDANGMLYKADFDENEKTLVENTIKFTRLLRMVQENVHASLKKTFKFLDAKKMCNSYLKPFSRTEQRKYNLPVSHKKIPKLSVYTVVACSLLNEIHPGYRPLYLSAEDQEPMADNILLRMSVENPLLYEDIWPISFTGAGTRDRRVWSMVKVAYLEYVNEHFLGFPIPAEADVQRLATLLAGGVHNLLKTSEMLTYINKLYFKDSPLSPEELLRRCEAFPDHMEVFYTKIEAPADFVPSEENPVWVPDWWDEAKFGDWPGPMTLARCLIPPSMKSATQKSNFHQVVIAFGATPSDRLGQPPPFNRVYFWRCFQCPATCGSLSMDRHCATLLCALAFRQTYRSKARLATLLNPVALPIRQGNLILPPSDQSAAIPVDIPRKSSGSDRANNPFYEGVYFRKKRLLILVKSSP